MTLQTDVLVDGRAVEGIDERLLLFPSARVHLEVASDEELAGHVGYSVLREVVCEGYADKNEGKRRFGEATEVDRLDSRTIVDRGGATRPVSPSHFHYLILSLALCRVTRRRPRSRRPDRLELVPLGLNLSQHCPRSSSLVPFVRSFPHLSHLTNGFRCGINQLEQARWSAQTTSRCSRGRQQHHRQPMSGTCSIPNPLQ